MDTIKRTGSGGYGGGSDGNKPGGDEGGGDGKGSVFEEKVFDVLGGGEGRKGGTKSRDNLDANADGASREASRLLYHDEDRMHNEDRMFDLLGEPIAGIRAQKMIQQSRQSATGNDGSVFNDRVLDLVGAGTSAGSKEASTDALERCPVIMDALSLKLIKCIKQSVELIAAVYELLFLIIQNNNIMRTSVLHVRPLFITPLRRPLWYPPMTNERYNHIELFAMHLPFVQREAERVFPSV